MPRIKRIDTFMLQTFLPQFAMTFLICLFIVMMEFLWKYIDEMVGKGLSVDVVAELFFYAALSLTPLALPLAVLLASLMTFGNLGEHVELTAMKSSGISLMRVMAPLAALMVLVVCGAFYFANNVVPFSQVKMWTLLYSMRQKTPTLDIPEGTVFTQIPGYNLYVKHKDEANDMLYNLLIYDVSQGTGNPRIIAADSGRMSFTEDYQHLVLNLYQGTWYEDMRSTGGRMGQNLFRRESFHDKEIMIPYDNTFTRMDDESMRSQYVGKNIAELQHTIDSVQLRVDSVGKEITRDMRARSVLGVPTRRIVVKDNETSLEVVPPVKVAHRVNFDSLVAQQPLVEQMQMIDQAIFYTQNQKQDFMFRGYALNDDNFVIRRHNIELFKKFTLSLACLVFFFIGAPLGAIIRKGGLGTPIVVSVMMFIVYYIFDNSGYKLARDGRWPVWQGMWLSTAVLAPLGVFLTKKAVEDSAVFNPDAYISFFRRITGMHQERKLALKEVIIDEVDADATLLQIDALKQLCQEFLDKYPGRQKYLDYWQYGYDKPMLRQLAQDVDSLVDNLANSRDQKVLSKTEELPVIRQLLTYHPTNYPKLGMAIAIIFPLGLAGYLVGLRHQRILKRDIAQAITTCDQLATLIKN